MYQENLAIHTANCAGIDKESFDDRALWTAVHHNEIEEAYFALLEGNSTEWLDQFKSDKKTKWQLIAAIGVWGQIWTSECPDEEWVKIPGGLDATCSGLQILSIIGRDESCAEHVNIKSCTYAPVGDLYQYTWGHIRESLQNETKKCQTIKNHPDLQSDSSKLGRKVVKRNNMTFVYACQSRSMGASTFSDRKDHGDKIISELGYGECLDFGKVCFDNLERALPKATGIMKFLQECASHVETGALSWINPVTGFKSYQRYERSNKSKVKIQLSGKRVDLTIHEWYDKPKVVDHKRAIAANFTHSQDSALLFVTVDRMIDLGYTEFHCIHDQFGVNMDGMEDMSLSVRGSILDLYEAGDTLELFRDGLEIDVETPEKGKYDIYDIIDAEYVFC